MATTVKRGLRVEREASRFAAPFRIAGYLFEAMPSVVGAIAAGAHEGQGEAAGVYFLGGDQDHMVAEIERVRGEIEAGVAREERQRLLPAGGARNALDCALW